MPRYYRNPVSQLCIKWNVKIIVITIITATYCYYFSMYRWILSALIAYVVKPKKLWLNWRRWEAGILEVLCRGLREYLKMAGIVKARLSCGCFFFFSRMCKIFNNIDLYPPCWYRALDESGVGRGAGVVTSLHVFLRGFHVVVHLT